MSTDLRLLAKLRQHWADGAQDAALIAREAPTEAMRREWQAKADAAAIMSAVFDQEDGDES